MSRSIKETPVLTGKDVDTFYKNLMENVIILENPTKEELELKAITIERMKKSYEALKSITVGFEF
jgi:hypothetical protein